MSRKNSVEEEEGDTSLSSKGSMDKFGSWWLFPSPTTEEEDKKDAYENVATGVPVPISAIHRDTGQVQFPRGKKGQRKNSRKFPAEKGVREWWSFPKKATTDEEVYETVDASKDVKDHKRQKKRKEKKKRQKRGKKSKSSAGSSGQKNGKDSKTNGSKAKENRTVAQKTHEIKPVIKKSLESVKPGRKTSLLQIFQRLRDDAADLRRNAQKRSPQSMTKSAQTSGFPSCINCGTLLTTQRSSPSSSIRSSTRSMAPSCTWSVWKFPDRTNSQASGYTDSSENIPTEYEEYDETKRRRRPITPVRQNCPDCPSRMPLV